MKKEKNMLIYSDCGDKSDGPSRTETIRKSVFEVKTSNKRQNKLSKKNINFLLSLGLKLKKKK